MFSASALDNPCRGCTIIRCCRQGEARLKQPGSAADPLWYKDAIIYELHVKAFMDSNNDGIGDFPGLTEQARLPAGPGRHLPLAAAVLPFAAARRRLRHRRLPDVSTRTTARMEDFKAFLTQAHDARHAGHHRAGHQPHLRPASVVPARAPRAQGLARARLLRLERHRPEIHRTRASSSPTPRSRTGPGIRSPSSTTGTASSRTSRI